MHVLHISRSAEEVCPNEVMEAEDPGHEELDESMPEPDVGPRGKAVPETPSAKKKMKRTNSHISPRSRGAACAFEPIPTGQQVNVQRPKEWITCR